MKRVFQLILLMITILTSIVKSQPATTLVLGAQVKLLTVLARSVETDDEHYETREMET